MSITLINSAWLWLAAFAALPLLLHLFARARPPVYDFSSVEFLRRVVKKSVRWKKPQEWLLLLLRTLAVAALIAAFLRPLLFAQDKLSGLLQQKNLVAIVDASASMAYVESAQTRFATACAETSTLLSGLTGNDKANVIWLKADPEPIFPGELASNVGYLKDQLRRATVTSERGSINKAFALALELLEDTEGKNEICIISDFQASAWSEFAPELPEGTDLIHVKVGRKQASNQAISRVSISPPLPVIGEDLAVHIEVSNFSDNIVETTVFSAAGENRKSKNLTLPPNDRTSITLYHTLTNPGPLSIKASITEDAFPADNHRYATTEVRPYFSLGMIGATSDSTLRMWTRAAQALSWAVPEWLEENAFTQERLANFDAIYQTGNTPLPTPLPEHVKVIHQPAPGDNLTLLPPALEGSRFSAQREHRKENPFKVKIANPNDPLFNLFRSGDHGNLAGLSGTERIRLSPTPEGQVLLEFDDGSPALIRVAPRQYLWLMPLTEASGNLASRVEFLPFFGELLLSERQVGTPLSQLDYEPGDPVVWETDRSISRADLALIGPEQQSHAIEAADAGKWIAAPFKRPGIFPWEIRHQLSAYSVVNFPNTESDLASLTLEETQATASVAVERGHEVVQLRDGIKLWPWLLFAAICFFSLETGLAFVTSRPA